MKNANYQKEQEEQRLALERQAAAEKQRQEELNQQVRAQDIARTHKEVDAKIAELQAAVSQLATHLLAEREAHLQTQERIRVLTNEIADLNALLRPTPSTV